VQQRDVSNAALSPVEHGDVEGERASLRDGRVRTRASRGSRNWRLWDLSAVFGASPPMMPSCGERWPMARARSRARGRGRTDPGVMGARQEQDGRVSEARRGRSQANRRWPDVKQASLSASIGAFSAWLSCRERRGFLDGPPGIRMGGGHAAVVLRWKVGWRRSHALWSDRASVFFLST
jgi:hypothetical protein